MKVIIELSDYVKLESTENENEIYICLNMEGVTLNSCVKIRDLYNALHKMTAK